MLNPHFCIGNYNYTVGITLSESPFCDSHNFLWCIQGMIQYRLFLIGFQAPE